MGMGILSWIIFGLIAGAVAKLVMPGRDPGGCLITILLGIAGAVVGGFLYGLLTGQQQIMQFNIGSFLVAIAGAILLLIIYRAVVSRN